MAYWKLVTAEEPKHAIKASLRAGGTIGEGVNQSDTLDQRVRPKETYLAGSIGRKWLDDFSTRRPVGGPKGHETCRAKCYGLWAKERVRRVEGALAPRATSLSARDRDASLPALTR